MNETYFPQGDVVGIAVTCVLVVLTVKLAVKIADVAVLLPVNGDKEEVGSFLNRRQSMVLHRGWKVSQNRTNTSLNDRAE